VNEIDGGCDDESMRVLPTIPKWRPGKQGGIRVNVRMIILIHIRVK